MEVGWRLGGDWVEVGWRLGGDWVEIGWRLNSGGRVEKFGSGDQTVVLFFTSPYTFFNSFFEIFQYGWRLAIDLKKFFETQRG